MGNAVNKENKKKIIRFIPMVLMMLIIFIFSAMPGDDSSNVSSKFMEPIIKVVENTSHHQVDSAWTENLHWAIRKFAHFMEYAILGILALYALYDKNKKFVRLGLASELIAMLYACSDEFHQIFVRDRSASIKDVGIDSMGAFTGLVVVFLIVYAVRKRKKENETL